VICAKLGLISPTNLSQKRESALRAVAEQGEVATIILRIGRIVGFIVLFNHITVYHIRKHIIVYYKLSKVVDEERRKASLVTREE
jgi:hypothetical protein